MKALTIFVAAVFLSVCSLAGAEVVIKQVPLELNDIAGKNGQEMYDQLCAVCHGADGTGHGPATPALANPVPDLTQLGIGVRSQSEFLTFSEGGPCANVEQGQKQKRIL